MRRRLVGSGWWKVAAGVSIGALATGGIVLADGGDPNLVHACLIDGSGADGRPNTIILGPNDACPGGTTPKHWGVQGPAGPAGPAGATGAPGPPGAAGGTTRPKVVVVTKSKGTDAETHKTVEARCPADYELMSGHAEGTPRKIPGTAKILYYFFEENRPITSAIGRKRTQIGWRAKSHSGWYAEKVNTAGDAYRLFKIVGGKWKLSVTATCVLTGP